MSEKNKNKESKKWLISRMKISGSKRRRIYSPDYSETRNSKRNAQIEDLPTHESIGKSFNGKINTDLLKRFLQTQVGRDWDEVYSEIIQRIPTKLMDYKHYIYNYVADKIEIRDGKVWNLRDNHFIETNTNDYYSFKENYRHMKFYVDPQTNKLVRVGDFKSRKETREMNDVELRKYRENEKREKLAYKRSKTKSKEHIEEIEQILKEKNSLDG